VTKRGLLAASALVLVAATAIAQKPAAAPGPAKAKRALPPPVTSLDVSVTGPAGKPIEGAFVAALPVEGAYSVAGVLVASRFRSSVSGREGKAKLESLPAAPWNVTVHARGFVPRTLQRVAAGPLAVQLEKGGVISGVVREGEGQRPVSGARVEIASGLSLPAEWQQEATRNEVVTDAQGRFRLEGIGRGAARLVARAAGYARAERANVRAGASVELFLFAGPMISGTVRDEAGRPVKGAVVRAEGDQVWTAPPPERSDARGEFQVCGTPPGEYSVVAREGSRAPGFATVVVDPDGPANAVITLADGGFATGRILDGAGTPLAGRARVETVEGHGIPAFAADQLSADARADGIFTLGPLPLGTLGVSVSAAGHVARRVEAGISASGRSVDLGDLVLETGLAIRGRVRDRQGNAVGGASVHAERAMPGEASESDTTAGEDGRFTVAGLRPGRYSVSASATGYARASVEVEAGASPLDIVLGVAGEIAGRVVDADGAAVEDARVTAQGAGEERTPDRHFSGRAEEGDGRFVLRAVGAGTYSLRAQADGRGEAAVSDVRVAAGGRTDVGVLRLGRGGVVVGTVVDGDGRGIPGVSISVERDANQRSGGNGSQTGSSGAFEVRGVPTGPVHVFAQHPSYAETAPVVAEVDPEKEPVPVRIVLGRGGRVEGRAVHRDGRPFAGGRISVYSSEPGGPGMRFDTSAISADGSFVVEHVAPGRTVVNLMAFTPSSSMVSGVGSANILTGVASQEVQVREGETTSVDLPLRDVVVAGRVTKAGQPAPGVTVEVMSERGSSVMTWVGPMVAAATLAAGGPPLLSGTSRDDGSYELLLFSPGPAYVEMHGSGQSYPGRQVEIPDAERFDLDLEIGAAPVTGIVVDRDGGGAVAGASVGLRPTSGDKASGGAAECAPDGRFSLSVEPGDYTLHATAPGRQPASLPVTVGPSGASDIRIELERGLEISGHLVDGSGRPAAGFLIRATGPDAPSGGYANSRPDGSFTIGGLRSEPYALVGGSELAGFAFRPGVVPGGEPLTLSLRPVGRIVVRVVDASGQPVPNAYPRVESIDGIRVSLPGQTSGPTDAAGLYTLPTAPGLVGVKVGAEKSSGRGTVAVASGETTSLTVRLEPDAPPK